MFSVLEKIKELAQKKRTNYLNSSLSTNKRYQVLLHELGHLNHSQSIYNYASIRCENEANRFMIRNPIQEELAGYDDLSDFNWSDFAKKI